MKMFVKIIVAVLFFGFIYGDILAQKKKLQKNLLQKQAL